MAIGHQISKKNRNKVFYKPIGGRSVARYFAEGIFFTFLITFLLYDFIIGTALGGGAKVAAVPPNRIMKKSCFMSAKSDCSG